MLAFVVDRAPRSRGPPPDPPSSCGSAARCALSSDEVLVTTLEHAAYPLPASQEAELRGCVQAFVDERRGSGTPPERLIIELKELIRTVHRKRRLSAQDRDSEGIRHLSELLVVWAIERYYQR